jgi:hypothetical protein
MEISSLERSSASSRSSAPENEDNGGDFGSAHPVELGFRTPHAII